MAAIMVIYDHVKEDVECLDLNATLLKTCNYIVKTEGIVAQKRGAYLHYDCNDCAWIRSGKVTGRGFVVREAEHDNKGTSRSYHIPILLKMSN